MDAAFVPEGTLDKATLKGLMRRSDARGAARLLSHGALLVLTALSVSAARGTFWLLPAMLGHGIVLVFLFAPLHETIHRTAFARRAVNDAVAWACGLALLLPPTYFGAFHFAHHRHTQDPARDPELSAPKPRTWARYLLLVSGLLYWRERATTLFRHACARVDQDFLPRHLHDAVVREARTALAAYALVTGLCIAVESAAVLLYWIVPAVLGQPFLRAFLMAEHAGCPLVPDMLRNGRTTRSNAVVRWLTWNMPYHAEHHAYPALPFHALPAAHALLEARIAVRASGYLHAHREIVAAFGDGGRGSPLPSR